MSIFQDESIRGLNVRLQYANALLASQIGIPNSRDLMDDVLLNAFDVGIYESKLDIKEMPILFKAIKPLEFAWHAGQRWQNQEITESMRERE